MTGWAIETLAASSLLMLLVLALRGPVAARFGAHAAYMLWLLPGLRMILPRIPETALPARAAPIRIDIARLVAAAEAHPAMAAPIAAAPAQGGVDWMTVALALWLGGAIAYLAWQLGRHRRFMALALDTARLRRKRGGVAVGLSPAVSGPLAAGIFHRHILLPEDFARRYNGQEQRLALAHEIAHHRRGDLIANAVALAVLALHWFNPIAHWAYRAFRADQELACDATVLARAPSQIHVYGAALIKSARAGMPAAACALGPATQLKRRMKMIALSTRSRSRRIMGASLAAIVVAAGLGLTASGGMASPSRIAPTATRPLFEAAPGMTTGTIVTADRSGRRTTTTATVSGTVADAAMPTPPAPPVPPVSAMAPVAPVPPVPAVAAVAPMQPVPPVPPMPQIAEEVAADSAASAAQAAAAAAEGAATAASAAAQAASASALRMVANMDIDKIVQDSLKQAYAGVGKACADRGAKSGCVDVAAINREVADALREARDEVRNDPDVPGFIRARIVSQLNRAAARAEKDQNR